MNRTRTVLIVAAILVALSAGSASAEVEKWKTSISAAINYHYEYRSSFGEANLGDAVLSADFLVLDFLDLYAGGRLGWYFEYVCTAAMDEGIHGKPSFGGQLYFLGPTIVKGLSYSAGIAADTLVNLDRIHLSEGEPLYLFLEAFCGLRIELSDKFYLEGRIEGGAFPAFQDPPVFVKAGMQLGYRIR
jgi:hypothetical protein